MSDYNEKMAESFMDMAGNAQMREEQIGKKLDEAMGIINDFIDMIHNKEDTSILITDAERFIRENTPAESPKIISDDSDMEFPF